MIRAVILISGRGSNMEAILREARDGALRGCCEVVLVFANNPAAPGLARATQLGAPTACIDSRGMTRRQFDRRLLSLLEPYRADYLVLAGYMRILSPPVIERYRDRIVNIHPADTALFRGLGAYEWAFRSRLPSTKITVHLVDESVDTGAVLAQSEVDLRGAETLEEVERRGLAIEHRFYSETLRQLFCGGLDAVRR